MFPLLPLFDSDSSRRQLSDRPEGSTVTIINVIIVNHYENYVKKMYFLGFEPRKKSFRLNQPDNYAVQSEIQLETRPDRVEAACI